MTHNLTRGNSIVNTRTIITILNFKTRQFFFSTDHCQGVGTLSDDWVPCTSEIPMYVAPRPGLEDGMIRTVADYVKIFYYDSIEIPNPDSQYQV